MRSALVAAAAAAALAALPSGAGADPPLPSPTNCHHHIATPHLKISYIAARFTTCEDAIHQAHRWLNTADCQSRTYCAMGHLDWACKNAYNHTTGYHYADCSKINGHQEAVLGWQRVR